MDIETPPVSDAYLAMLAKEVAGNNRAILDDLIQEGRIEVWRISKAYPDKPPGFYAKSAKRRMIDIAWYGEPMTGEPSHKGRSHDLADDKNTISLFTPVTETMELAEVISDTIAASGDFDSAELAYHRQEIHDAVAKLSPAQRAYVFARFWLDMSPAEMKAEGINPKTWTQKRHSAEGTSAKARLAETLAHLREVTLYA